MTNFRTIDRQDGISAAAFGGRVASGEAFGAVHRRSDRRSRLGADERGLSRLGFGFVSSRDVAGPVGLRVRDGGVLQPEAGAGDLRLGGVSVHCGQRSSRPRHDRRVPAAVLEGHREAVRRGSSAGARGGRGRRSRRDVDPDELARREERLRKIAEARATIEGRARERHAREKAEHDARMAAREARTAETGKKPRGKPPAPPTEGPLPTDQVNLTDAASRIMPAAGGGFEQGYNARAAVAAGSLLVVAVDVVQAPNDKNQVEPMLEKIGALPEGLGKVDHLLADTGYFSAGTVAACEKAGVEPAIAMGRQPHHPPLSERFAKAPAAPDDPTPVEAMAHRLKTPEGRALYSLRKQTPEPVFGIIKSALGFRQFSLRGLENVHGEWSLVTMAWNLKRMFVLNPAC